MWIRVTGELKSGIKYACVPEGEYKQLQTKIEQQQDCIGELLPITRRFIEICELYKEKNPDVEVAIAQAEAMLKP